MKEHVQDYGVRKWAGDDLIELQAEPLSALQALVAPYAPCILTGCELETVPDGNGDYRLHAGYVALKGRKTVENGAGAGTDGTDTGAGGEENGADAGVAATAENGDTTAAQAEEYVKIVRVTAQTVKQPTVFLTLACTPLSRAYGNGENKAIAYDYTAEVCDVLSKVGDRPYLTLVADAENPCLLDTLGITKKLDREDGEAQDTVVKFTETFTETDSVPDRPELKSGSRLGLLMRQIRKWFDELKDLKDLAFKDKVAKTDLDADLQGELDGKVTQEEGMGLSQANFTTAEKLKLKDIEKNANKYVHPTGNGYNHIPSGGSSGNFLRWSDNGTAKWEAGDYASRTDSRLTDSRTPKGSAGGDLTGSYPEPTIKSSVKLPGSPTIGTTPDTSDSSTKIASTAYVKNNLANYVTTSDSRLADSRTPTGTAGGDLTGTYPNPTIKSSVKLPGSPTINSSPATTDNSTKIATTAYVKNNLANYAKIYAAGFIAASATGSISAKIGSYSLNRDGTLDTLEFIATANLTNKVIFVMGYAGYVVSLEERTTYQIKIRRDSKVVPGQGYYFVVLQQG